MKKLTSKMSKSVLLFQRALVLLGFAVCSLAANAGQIYYANLTIKEYTSTDSPTGSGKVYVKYYYSRPYTDQEAASFNYDSNVDDVNLTGGKPSAGPVPFYLAVHPISTNSIFAGWYKNDSPIDLTKGVTQEPTIDNGVSYVLYYTFNINAQSTSQDNPTPDMLQAHFGRKVHILSYDGESDAWVDNISTPDDPDRYAYSANINSPQFSLLYNLVLHTKFNDKTITLEQNDDSPFNLSLEAGPNDAEGRKTWRLTVTPKGVAESYVDDVVFQIDGEDVVTLALNLSRQPITVTLNPAEDLSGTYTYTQNSTGSQVFSVTTSAIVKQMVTSTDYSFTFTPTPKNTSTHQFEKWIITKSDASTEEYFTPNLSYRFSGGESITPVFTDKDRAVFIVKGEDTQYVDLQAAIDRAATTKDKIVTVYAPQQLTSAVRLEKGNYRIHSGVTLLIPGESSYATMVGNVSTSNFASDGSFSTYCTLKVDDGTKIDVENGNISIYAKMHASQGKNGQALNHGHMQLGKNCEIVVKSGGLYCFGFITGDNSSHITMKNGTKVYEAFHFTDWRGGDETNSMKDNDKGVLPMGQYYIQSVEVPMTLEYGAVEYVVTAIDVSVAGIIEANVKFIDKYSEDLCLFGLGEGTSLTKSYDPATDRLKFEFNGNSTSSKVKIGHMELNMKAWGLFGVEVDSKDFVMPIQNNIDIDVKNTTINLTSDVAFLPGAVMRVHDNAVINVNENGTGSEVRAYIYDRGARKLKDGTGFWYSSPSILRPLSGSMRPGGIKKVRNENDLVDARLIINGVLNINNNGFLYTVKGDFEDVEGELDAGADITSEGSGRINVNNRDDRAATYQWKQDVGAQVISLTSPNLLLHNDVDKQPEGSKNAYTEVSAIGSYIYYQHDGTWRTSQAGITGVKLYDTENNEMDKFLVTNPNVEFVDGYLLATLEQLSSVNPADFSIKFTEGNIALKEGVAIENGRLKIPVRYTTQNKHGNYTQDITISYPTTDPTITITVPVFATEDYTPVFEVPSSLNIYAKVQQPTAAALPITYAENNVVTILPTDLNTSSKTKWTATWTGNANNYFKFEFGTAGQELSGAKIIFTPANITAQTCTLTLTATYTDANDKSITSVERKVVINGNGLMIDNTLEFNDVGTITENTTSFELLKGINSEGAITYEILEGDATVVTIDRVDASDVNSNYIVTPSKVGQVKIQVTQAATDTHNKKTIEKTIVVVADPEDLTAENSCIEDLADFQMFTADLQNVTFDNGDIKFAVNSSWTAQFSNMPGTLTFTPHGDGYWAIQESKDGVNWSQIVWWTQLPEQLTTIALHPTTRKVQIAYNKSGEEIGYLEELCIHPFTIHAEVEKVYVPIRGGSVQSTQVVFTHKEAATPTISPIADWTISATTTNNLGGVLNTYYQTIVTLSGEADVPEQNNGYTITATQGSNSAMVNIGTYTFPKPLPMSSESWVKDENGENGYDKSEYYYHYMTDSRYAKWDAQNRCVIFLNKGSDQEAKRQVVFGYYGLPSEIRFESSATDWLVEESADGTTWTSAAETLLVKTVGSMNTMTQPINHTSKYVRITYIGDQQTEVLLSNIVIEGFPSAVPNKSEVEVSKGSGDSQEKPSATFDIHVMNLERLKLNLDNTSDFTLYRGVEEDQWVAIDNSFVFESQYYDFLAMNEQGDIKIKVEWVGANLVNEGHIELINPDKGNVVLSMVRIVGKKDAITKADANTGIWTGVPDGVALGRPTADKYTLNGSGFEPYTYHEVNVKNAFDDAGKALFNYMVIYGETTTTDDNKTITTPTKTAGSNAKTPYYIYERNPDGKSYKFVQAVENANSAQKANLSGITHFNVVKEENGAKYYAIKPTPGEPLSFYMTGFCPYATTGSTKDDEGVWYFQGEVGDQLHIYLEDCHIYSRNKSYTGQTTAKNDDDSPDFGGVGMVQGSGAVLVFENAKPQDLETAYFGVQIHTRGHNILKSNYGAYYTFIGTMQATQISSPIQVRLGSDTHVAIARTSLDFDDLWPTQLNDKTQDMRTNGFLSLQKLANNAPSIDLGNDKTVVNFRGGQVQLQNATIGSPNYKTTLAISHRSGKMGNVEIQMAYGIGTDDVGGTVNFYDGTTTVLPMYVEEAYKAFYLIDTDANGNEIKVQKGTKNGKPVYEYRTSCLRTPTNTYVYGGSHCMMRACNDVTSRGGAPKDGPTGVQLGRYVYTKNGTNQGYSFQCVVTSLPTGNPEEEGYREGAEIIYDGNKYRVVENQWVLIGSASSADPCYLVEPTNFPGNLKYKGEDITKYYQDHAQLDGKGPGYVKGEYGLHSITPDADGNLSFWIPEGVVEGVEPEKDVLLTHWKACMTYIKAAAFNVEKAIGGDVTVAEDELITNFLYCQLDQDIHNVINNGSYAAPVVDPTGMLPIEEKYQQIPPTEVGEKLQYSVNSADDYTVTNKIYYITTALADTWMNFTMPFDVEKIWVVETYKESEIEDYFSNPTDKREDETQTQATMRYQASHNADFAAFFGVAMAIGDGAQSFEDIYDNYIDWAKNKADIDNGLYMPVDGVYPTYDLRGKYPLTHYNGKNFTSAHYYLYKNTGDWEINKVEVQEGNETYEVEEFVTNWTVVPNVAAGKAIMKAGETYSLLFPYCTGCDVEMEKDPVTGEVSIVKDPETHLPMYVPRDYWDYWSGKFLIFESTQATEKEPHVIKGSDYIATEKVPNKDWLFDNYPSSTTTAALTGNSTFKVFDLDDSYGYVNNIYTYVPVMGAENFYPIEPEDGYPTITPTTSFLMSGSSTRAKLITRDGRIIRDSNNGNQNGTSGGRIPTVGGGNDLFVTSIAGGINVAVAAPQNVRVLSSSGAVIYSGHVTTAVDIKLPTNGIYIVSGENEVQKILY